MDSRCPAFGVIMGKTMGIMTKKEQFMAFILVGATARDITEESNDSQLILHMAERIPCDAIPINVMNAAKVYLEYCSRDGKQPFRWMLKVEAGAGKK
jgi:hypothetical protein